MRVALLISTSLISTFCALSCRAKRNPQPEGAACEKQFDCESELTCYEGACAPRRLEGETCDPKITEYYEKHCKRPLACSPSGICETISTREAREASEAQEREREMLRQSGVDAKDAGAPTAERPVPTPAAGLKVRVSRVKAPGLALAACRDDERLVGGGCQTEWQIKSSYPSHFSEDDTLGARWNCFLGKKATAEVEAYALCQEVGHSSEDARDEVPRTPVNE